MPGTLIPPWYHPNIASRDELATASVIWGLSLGLTAFAIIRAFQQTSSHWRRTGKITPYIFFIWLELFSSTIMGGVAWGHVVRTVPSSLWFYLGIVILWIIQVQCILQIIITRIALLAFNKTLIWRLKWGVFIVVLVINISVGCIWIPARLQISHTWMQLNKIWDRLEKSVLAVVDAGLNAYFIYLVRSNLISYGLTKYVRLYRFNIAMIGVSLTMDVLIIGMMSLRDTFIYFVFHPFAYLIKLHIEMTMAELIAKIVKASGRGSGCCCDCHHHDILTPLHNIFAPHRTDILNHHSTFICHRESSFAEIHPVTPGRLPRWGHHRRTPWAASVERPKKVARTEKAWLKKTSWLGRSPSLSTATEELEMGVAPKETSEGSTPTAVNSTSEGTPPIPLNSTHKCPQHFE